MDELQQIFDLECDRDYDEEFEGSECISPSCEEDRIDDRSVNKEQLNFEPDVARAMEQAGVQKIAIRAVENGKQVYVELLEAKEVKLPSGSGADKILIANKVQATLLRTEDGAVVVHDIKGISVDIPLFEGGPSVRARISRVELGYDREGRAILKVTGTRAGIERTVEVPAPEGAAELLQTLNNTLSSKLNEAGAIDLVSLDSPAPANDDVTTIKLLLGLGAVAVLVCGGRKVWNAMLAEKPAAEAPAALAPTPVDVKPGNAPNMEPGKIVEFQGDRWKIVSVDNATGRTILYCSERAGFTVFPITVPEADFAASYEEVQIEGNTYYRRKDGKSDAVYSKGPSRAGKVILTPEHEYAVVAADQLSPKAAAAVRGQAANAEFGPGQKLELSGGGAEVLHYDQQQQRVLIKDTFPIKGSAEPVSISPDALAKDFGEIEAAGKKYVFLKQSGKVFEPLPDGKYRPVLECWALTPEDIRAEIQQKNADALFKALTGKPVSDNARRFHDANGSPPNNPDVKVSTEGANLRIFEAGGKNVRLFCDGHGWFYVPEFKDGQGRRLPNSDVKVHVLALSSSDLAAVQSKLIPELMAAAGPGGPLEGKIQTFKTHDPMIGVKAGWAAEMPWNQQRTGNPFEAGPSGQAAKAFTIYATSPEAARDVQLYVDNYLKRNGLALEGKVETGNVGDGTVIKDGSNRVTLEQDHWQSAKDAAGNLGYKFSATLSDAVTEYALRRAAAWGYSDPAAMFADADSRTLKPEVLKQLEKEFHMDGVECRLAYAESTAGEGARLMLIDNVKQKYVEAGYLPEGKKQPVFEAGQLKSGVSGRGAMYHISDIVGGDLKADLDPARIQLKKPRIGTDVRLNGESCRIVGETGKFIVVMRTGTEVVTANPISSADLSAKYEPLKLIIDGTERTVYFEKGHPEKGLFAIKRAGGNLFIGRETSLSVIVPQSASMLPVVRLGDQLGTPSSSDVTMQPPVEPKVEPRPVPEPPKPPTLDKIQTAEVRLGQDGTLTRDEVRIGETMSPERLKEQRELSADQIRFLEVQAERLRATGKPEDAAKASELETTVKALRGQLGAAAKESAHRGIIEEARRQAELKAGRGGGFGAAVGLGILVGAALGWYATQRRSPASPLNRASVSGK